MIQKVSSPCLVNYIKYGKSGKTSAQVSFQGIDVMFSKAEHLADVPSYLAKNTNRFHELLAAFKEKYADDETVNKLLKISIDKFLAGDNTIRISADVGYSDSVIANIKKEATGQFLISVLNNTSGERIATAVDSDGEQFFKDLEALISDYGQKAADRMDPKFYAREVSEGVKINTGVATESERDLRRRWWLI